VRRAANKNVEDEREERPECMKISFLILNVGLKKGPQTQDLGLQYGMSL